MDMAGAIGKVGFWIESGLFFPEKVTKFTDLSGLGKGTLRSTVLENKPYLKYAIGADYNFKNGWYINGQYLHGFIHEKEAAPLGDYIVFALEKRFLNDKLKIIPVGGGLEIRDFNDIKNRYALILAPELSYYPVDNVEIDFGFRLLEGKGKTTFGGVKNNDDVYLRIKYSF